MASHEPAASFDKMAGMSMSTAFSTGTRVTLFFTEWTTTTIAAYVATIICLFFLTLLNRFLGALKFQTERAWLDQTQKRNTLLLPPGGRNTRPFFKAKSSPIPPYMIRENDSECDPLTVQMNGESANVWSPKEQGPVSRRMTLRWMLGDWQPSGRWNIKKDGLRAILEFTRAFIGYILMLAVMTLNLGIFFTVLGGILVGELIFGRYMQGSGGWQEGACHEG
ncbi:hypothetical protein OIDMADRAFT_20079 [Oidiodendron maius Zn]|uniref:Copper transport protein n=1 Tax=Oidiodendron maius (strain Zn) TaxID=913774 RepID=A0A0C3D919_OIDMZ|nr:hypothetical protein OIDMADRAFT_20079 [Oidiodendron maius Zn]